MQYGFPDNEGTFVNYIVTDQPEPDEQTGVCAYCSSAGCDQIRLFYSREQRAYICTTCNTVYPYETSGNEISRSSSSSSLAPLSESATKQEFFIEPVPVAPRSVASMPSLEDLDIEYRQCFMSEEEKRREAMGWSQYREVEISGTSPNVLNSQKENERIRMQKAREHMNRYYNLMKRRARERAAATEEGLL